MWVRCEQVQGASAGRGGDGGLLGRTPPGSLARTTNEGAGEKDKSEVWKGVQKCGARCGGGAHALEGAGAGVSEGAAARCGECLQGEMPLDRRCNNVSLHHPLLPDSHPTLLPSCLNP